MRDRLVHSIRLLTLVCIAWLVVCGGAFSGEIEDKLKLLEDAHNAGLLSEEEFRQKKALLLEEGPRKSSVGRGGPSLVDGQKGQVLTHPTGISVWCPAGWQMKMLEGILQIVPPDAGQGEQYESYFLTSERVDGYGIQQADHPFVVQYLDEQMTELGYHLGVLFQRVGEIKPVRTGQGERNGIRLDYRADSNFGPAHAAAFATVVKGWGLFLAGVGVGDRLERRSSTINRIFSSFDVGEGQKDQRLIGVWRLIDTRSITNRSVWETDYSRAQAVSENTSSLRFNPDGTWHRTNRSHTLVGAGGVWLEDKSSSSQNGRWNADGKHLFMLWEDGSFADYQYGFDGSRLKMAHEKTLEIWYRE